MSDQAQAIEDVLSSLQEMPSRLDVEQRLRDHVMSTSEEVLTDALHAMCIEVMPGLLIKSDDVLVLESASYITSEHLALIKADVFKRMPMLRDVVVLQHVHVAGVYREVDQ